jgi:hypothetical protein
VVGSEGRLQRIQRTGADVAEDDAERADRKRRRGRTLRLGSRAALAAPARGVVWGRSRRGDGATLTRRDEIAVRP